ncbi:hypothetical protein GCM10010217_66470 [Streptomyces tubercidicus]
MSGLPGMSDAVLKMREGRRLARGRQRVLVEGVPYVRKARVAGTGEKRDRRRVLTNEIGKVRHAESLSDPQNHREFRHLEPSPLDLFYPAR